MRTTDQALRCLATRVGSGDHSAFRCLYAILAPATLSATRDDLPDPVHSMHVVRATFCEVWWMCAFDVRCGCDRHDVAKWIAAIAERRCDERRQTLQRTPARERVLWTGVLADHDEWTRIHLAAMLDGDDALPPRRSKLWGSPGSPVAGDQTSSPLDGR